MSDRSPDNNTDVNNNDSTRSAGLASASHIVPSSDGSSRQEAQVDGVEEERLYDPEYTRLILDDERPPRSTRDDKSFYPIILSEEEIASRFAEQRTGVWSESETSAIDSIGGLDEIMTAVWIGIRYPLDRPEFCRYNRPKRGLILHGPNGVGKTMLIKALVEGCSRYNPKMTAFHFAMYFDKVDQSLITLFQQAKQRRPSVIFLDDFDALGPHKSLNVRTLAALMDTLDDSGSVFVIAATDQLDKVDPVLRKSGRFDAELLIDLPNFAARKDILHKMTSTWGLQPSVIGAAANGTSGFTGADLRALCYKACVNALERTHPNFIRSKISHDVKVQTINFSTKRVEMEDFKEALRTVKSTKQRLQNAKESRRSSDSA